MKQALLTVLERGIDAAGAGLEARVPPARNQEDWGSEPGSIISAGTSQGLIWAGKGQEELPDSLCVVRP